MSVGILAETKPVPSDTALMYFQDVGNGVTGNVFFVNQGEFGDFVRIAITPFGQVPQPESYLLYDTVVPPHHTVVLQEIALAVLERLYVYSQNGTTSFVYTGTMY